VGSFNVVNKTFLTLRRRVNVMIKNKLVMGLSLTLLVAVGSGGLVQAKNAGGAHNVDGDRIETQNSQYKGLKSPHSSRKEAANRLKVHHQQRREQEAQGREQEAHGSTNSHHGHDENGSDHNQNSSTQGGAQ
jgi:hypothetical protein